MPPYKFIKLLPSTVTPSLNDTERGEKEQRNVLSPTLEPFGSLLQEQYREQVMCPTCLIHRDLAMLYLC